MCRKCGKLGLRVVICTFDKMLLFMKVNAGSLGDRRKILFPIPIADTGLVTK